MFLSLKYVVYYDNCTPERFVFASSKNPPYTEMLMTADCGSELLGKKWKKKKNDSDDNIVRYTLCTRYDRLL